jgi:Ca-activated chloride channel family protein
MFTFGIGNNVNRYLIDSMAEEGRGSAEYVTLAEAADRAVLKFAKQMSTPVLTNVTAEFSGVSVSEIQPVAMKDVFADQPIVIHGRFAGTGSGQVVLRGQLGGKPWSQTVPLTFTANRAPAVPVLWARKRVSEIERSDYLANVRGAGRPASVAEITKVGLDFGIMTQYTSFVAVEQRIVNVGGKQRTVNVPVEQADGVTFGAMQADKRLAPATVGSTFNIGGGRAGGGGGAGGFGGLGGGGGGVTSGGASEQRVYKLKARYADSGDLTTLRQIRPEDREEQKEAFIDAKVHPKLKAAKGNVEVQIFVEKLDEKTLKLLASKGVKIEDKDANLRVVFASIHASQFASLAILDEVTRIDPI